MNISPARRDNARALVDGLVRATLRQAGRGPVRYALERLLRAARGRSTLLRPVANRRDSADELRTILDGLLALATHFKEWIGTPEEWNAPGGNPRPEFASLARHLLTRYPVPAFLTSAWFCGTGAIAQRHQRSYIHLGRGGGVRSAGFPARLTRTMAHSLVHAPAHLSVEHALRWAQVKALGGDDTLAEALARSRLGWDFHNDDFWLTVIRWFINQRPLAAPDVSLLIDYLQHRRFYYQPVIIGDETEVYLDPAEPDLSMKGRSLAALLRRAREWHEVQAHTGPVRRLFRWDASPIGPFQEEDAEGRTWTIRELLDSDALAQEGKAMHHCVADHYLEECLKRETTIWSLGIESAQGREHVLTIEVAPESKSIRQASMHCNADPDERCRAILGRWAAQEALSVDCLTEEEPAAP